MATDDKLAKLPAWVRGVIDEQQNEIDRLTRELRLARGESGKTAWAFRTRWDSDPAPVAERFDDIEVRLPGYDEGLGRERKVDLRITGEGQLEVRGGRPLAIRPQASNAFVVDVEGR